MLHSSLPAFIGQHSSATLAVRQALSEQAGGSLCWQLPVFFLISPGALALSPLSVYSLGSPDTSRAVETPARVQQSQTCHYISLCRERNRADAACRELPWGREHGCTCRARSVLAPSDPQLRSLQCHQQWRSLPASHNVRQDRPGWWDQAQEQNAVLFSIGKLQGDCGFNFLAVFFCLSCQEFRL